MERIIVRNEQKMPPLIDPLLLEVALRSKFINLVSPVKDPTSVVDCLIKF